MLPDNHAVQEQVLDGLSRRSGASSTAIRACMTEGDDTRFRQACDVVVTLAALRNPLEAAIKRDLFAEDDDGVFDWLDAALLDRLATRSWKPSRNLA